MRSWNETARLAIALVVCAGALRMAGAQDRSLTSVAHGATAQERLLMEQIDQLAGAGQISEALASLKRLVDQSQGRLIEVGELQRAATLSVQLHLPIADWALWRLARWSVQYPDKLQAAARTDEEQASRALQSLGIEFKGDALKETIARYPLASSATAARLMLCDFYLDRGWSVAARQALEAPGLGFRAWPVDAQQATHGNGLPWTSAWPHLSSSKSIGQLLEHSWHSIHAPFNESDDALRLALLKRSLAVTALDATSAEMKNAAQWVATLGERLPMAERGELNASIRQSNDWFAQRTLRLANVPEQAKTFAANSSRRGSDAPNENNKLDLGSWTKWTRALERMTGQLDRNPASKPPVAEGPNGILPYYPLVYDGKVFVHELTRITAFDATSGKSWPPTEPSMPLYDSGATAASFFPFGYSMVGAPRGTLTIDDDRLYARMGPPVTGWFGRAPTNENLSLSSLVALDLKRQGSMRPGFPVRLPGDEFPHAEFEGTPTVVGQQVLVCVIARDNVNLRRYVVSIDRDTGSVIWRSPMLASGMVSGCEQASLVSHQLLSVAGGRIFVNTNLGSVACLDLETGQIVWLVRYQRATASADEAYARPDRFRYRDLTPCMIVGTQVVCAPQDCPELFALDSASGQLLWSTDAERVDDANQLLGAYQQNLIVSGDRLYWLDASSGQVLAAFPAGGVGEMSTALPSPRGYGRGLIVGDRVYWPTQNEIFVFDAQQSSDAIGKPPAIRERLRLETRGAEGGNLTLFGDGLIIAGPGRLFVFD